LVFTFCRGQWLALAGGVGLIGWVKDRRVWALLLVVAVVAAAAVYFSPAGAASGRFTLGDPAFENYRDVLWRGGLKVLFARPLTGFGPNTIKIVFPDQTRFYSPVAKVIGWHNDFLQLAVESGLPGAAAGVWLAVAAFAVAWRRFRRGGDDAGLGLGLAAALVTLAAAAMVGNVVTDPAMIMEFVLLWGLFAPLAANREDGHPDLP
jgi:O-antigen ligase